MTHSVASTTDSCKARCCQGILLPPYYLKEDSSVRIGVYIVPLPPFLENGDLPPGIHPVSLRNAIDRFGTETPQRMLVALRLEHIYRLAAATGYLSRCIVFGSFVTAKPEPNDVDLFFLMADEFDAGSLSGEVQMLFDHAVAQSHFGASIFWLRRLAALQGEDTAVEQWQGKRDGGLRGIVEIIPETL
jgi:hypothetical protein